MVWDPLFYRPYPFPQTPGIISLPPLRRLDLCGIAPQVNFFRALPPTLEYLRLHAGSSRPSPLDVRDSDSPLPNLQTLIISDSGWVTDDTLTTIFNQFDSSPIRTLHLDQCFNLTGDAFLSLLMGRRAVELRKMTDLSMSHMRSVNDRFAELLSKQLLELKVLNLSYTRITGVTIRMFADVLAADSCEGPRLDRLFVRGCEDVSSDAVAYGREKGLEVVV